MRIIGYMEIRLFDADELEPEGAFQDALSRVPDTRRDKVLRMRFGEGRRLSLAAGLLLADWMREIGIDPMTAALAEGPNGKPYLPETMPPEEADKIDAAHSAASVPHTPKSRVLICAPAYKGPGNPRARFFNLSHAGHYAVLAISDREIGVDIEEIRRSHIDVARHFFHPAEQAFLFSAPEDAQPDLFCDIWTRKEACIKAIGAGLSYPLTDFSVADDSGFPAEILLPAGILPGDTSRETAFSGARLSVTSHGAPAGYHLAAAELLP